MKKLLIPAALALTMGVHCVQAADRVLVMAISEYARAPLPGAKHDADNARQIVELMGVSTDNFRAVADKQLTADGINRELAQLVSQTENGDRVFIFFSGHGSSRYINGRCEQALVSQDIKPVSTATIAGYLGQIKDKASKVVMLVDACHSGGVVEEVGTRSISAKRSSGLRAKFIESDDPAERCSTPVNIVEEKVTRGTRSTRGIPVEKNYLYLAAARKDEVAFDDEARGGMATSSILECLKGSVPDLDHSGSVSFQELVKCAQGRIDSRFQSDPVNRPHHITLSGNPDLPLVLATASGSVDPAATLKDMANGADSRWQVRLESNVKRARINKDAFKLSVTSNQDGYLYLLYVGSDRREFLQLYPDSPSAQNQVYAGQTFRIPGEFAAGGPAGSDSVLAVVSAQPRDFSAVFGKEGSAPATAGNAAALQDASCASRNLRKSVCPDEGTRNIKRRPSRDGDATSYGAALVELVEE